MIILLCRGLPLIWTLIPTINLNLDLSHFTSCWRLMQWKQIGGLNFQPNQTKCLHLGLRSVNQWHRLMQAHIHWSYEERFMLSVPFFHKHISLSLNTTRTKRWTTLTACQCVTNTPVGETWQPPSGKASQLLWLKFCLTSGLSISHSRVCGGNLGERVVACGPSTCPYLDSISGPHTEPDYVSPGNSTSVCIYIYVYVYINIYLFIYSLCVLF